MKKIVSIVMAVLLLFSLSACGSSEEQQSSQEENLRPELKNHIENLERYDTIILGFPNWWGDLPMPVYSFLTEYDF